MRRIQARERLPGWLKVRFPAGDGYHEVKTLMRDQRLHTVCEEARCPNIGECWNAGTATFLILGDVCTRACGFCAVTSGRPGAIDELEPLRLARTVELLRLDYCVITSVNRDDQPDGGAHVFARCINAIRYRCPRTRVEVLIPDFMGDHEALRTVVRARPFVLNHNVETVPRLYPAVRFKARYERSLELLARAKREDSHLLTKSGLMVGLGETIEEVFAVMRDLRDAGVDIVTIGQYLRPTARHLPVRRYYAPQEYEAFREEGRRLGLAHVEAGPLVRSSYHAERQADLRRRLAAPPGNGAHPSRQEG